MEVESTIDSDLRGLGFGYATRCLVRRISRVWGLVLWFCMCFWARGFTGRRRRLLPMFGSPPPSFCQCHPCAAASVSRVPPAERRARDGSMPSIFSRFRYPAFPLCLCSVTGAHTVCVCGGVFASACYLHFPQSGRDVCWLRPAKEFMVCAVQTWPKLC